MPFPLKTKTGGSCSHTHTTGIGALMSFLNVDILGETVEFDAFTTPGYAMVLLGIANIVLLFWMWTEPEKQRGG